MNNSRSSLPSSTQSNLPPSTPLISSTNMSFHHQTRPSINASSRSSAITTNSISTNITSSSINQIQNSNFSIEMPVATSSVVNKTASRSASLYQNCLEARSLMKRVPGFEQGPWITAEPSNIPPPYSSADLPPDAHPPLTPHSTATPNQEDPVTQTLDIIRLGSSLCYLYNAILNEPLSSPDVGSLPALPPGKTWSNIKPLNVTWSPREDMKGCQKSAAHFIMALKTELGWGTEIDETQENGLMVNMLYNSNTNATVKVISNVLRLLHLLKSLGVLLPPNEDDLTPHNNELNVAMDDRARVVKEILESERKYVQDLEVLQTYQRALYMREVLPSDQIRALFINLDSLVDFQRRFLIGVESNARLPPDEQRFGLLFTNLEDGFSCYEPFCANFASASQLAQDENGALTQVADILDPNYELPTFLIKPVQRICKYPLLLQQLVKHSDPSVPYYNELKEGLSSITRVTDAVNETTRQRENELAVNDLKERVEDWKGHDLVQFGQLVLEDTFTVVKNDSEREYHVYLFERIILCCKEVGVKLDKKSSKQSMSLKKNSPVHHNANQNPGKRKNTQQLKGRIFIANVMSATPRPVPPGAPVHQYLLQVTWRGDISEEYFSIKCRTEEQLKKWQAAITKAVDDAVERRRRQVHHLSSGSRSKMNSPLSQFPNTPQSEMGQPPNSAGYPHHLVLQHPRIPEHPYAHSGHGNGSGSISSRTFEDEEESYQTDVDSSANGRNTPSGSRRTAGHRSMPAERSDTSFGTGRARAQTDDAASANLAQWRSQMPLTSIPPIPRSGQVTPATTDAHMTASLRSSTSSKQLRHRPSHEWGSGSMNGSSSGLNRSDDPSSRAPPPSSNVTYGAYSNNRAESNHSTTQPSNNPAGIPMFRSRSASSPNIHQSLELPQKWSSNGIPNVPSLPTTTSSKPLTSGSRNVLVSNSSVHHMGHIKERSSDSITASMTDRSSSDSQRLSTGMNGTVRSLGGAATFSTQTSQSPQGVGSAVTQHQRNSSGQEVIATNSAASSLITSRTSGSLVVVQGAGAGTEVNGHHGRLSGSTLATVTGLGASTPTTSSTFPGALTMNNIGNFKNTNPTSVRYKLRAGEDTYVIVTLSTVTYIELIEKIYKKLKNCGVLKESSNKLKIRYEDEEGDLILICNDEDVAMAIDWMKSVGISHLLLFVD